MHTITKGLYFTSLDSRFNPCSREAAFYQLEKYSTDAGSVFALSSPTGKYSYSIGQQVNTVPRVELKSDLILNNVVKNIYLNAVSKTL